MLYLGYVLLRYVLIYNLEVSFNFHLTFLQLNVIKMFTAQYKLFFTLLSAIFFELPITRTYFRFPLMVRVIGSRLYVLRHDVKDECYEEQGVILKKILTLPFE